MLKADMVEIQNGLAALPGPVIFGTHIPAEAWKRFGKSTLDKYLDFWQKWPELTARQNLFVFFVVTYPRPHKSLGGLWVKWQDKGLSGCLEQFSFERYSRLVCVTLPELGDVTRSEADTWARRKEPQEFCELPELLAEIREIFTPCGDQMPMETFAEELKNFLQRSYV